VAPISNKPLFTVPTARYRCWLRSLDIFVFPHLLIFPSGTRALKSVIRSMDVFLHHSHFRPIFLVNEDSQTDSFPLSASRDKLTPLTGQCGVLSLLPAVTLIFLCIANPVSLNICKRIPMPLILVLFPALFFVLPSPRKDFPARSSGVRTRPIVRFYGIKNKLGLPAHLVFTPPPSFPVFFLVEFLFCPSLHEWRSLVLPSRLSPFFATKFRDSFQPDVTCSFLSLRLAESKSKLTSPTADLLISFPFFSNSAPQHPVRPRLPLP